MSDTWAVAAVTESFKKLLQRVAVDDSSVSPLDVVARQPDRVLADDANASRRKLNLFLYRITTNPGVANADLPFRDGSGDLVSQPVIGLDLDYLVTAYGRTHDELDAQHLLAHAMSLVHDNGVMRRQQIRDALTTTPMATSGLADQIEKLAIGHAPLSDEEMFRMWTAFGSPYRLSVGYSASVVLVQRTQRTRKAPPVRRAGLTVATARRPIVEDVTPAPATAGATLSISGLTLSADEVFVRLPSGDVTPTLERDDLLEVPLPASLRAGPNTLQVVHRLALNEGADTRPFAVSDVIPFTLIPTMTSPTPASAPIGGEMTLTVAPLVHRTQQVQALLGADALERRVLPGDPETTATLKFPIPAAQPAGSVPLRVQVDGAESALTPDASGVYANPKVTIA